MATTLRVARETTIIPAGDGKYRHLTVREASSVQGFPITYQWWGKTTAAKYKLVGNAVAPPVAFAIARAIIGAMGQPLPRVPTVLTRVEDPAPSATERERRRSLPLTRRFREHVPGSKLPGFRVDLDNQGAVASIRQAEDAGVTWRAVLYRGGGKAVRHRAVDLDEALRLLALTVADAGAKRRATAFLAAVTKAFAKHVPSATTLQLIRAERATGDVTPYVLLEQIGDVVARHFDSEPRVVHLDSHRDPDFVPVRIAATLVATAYVCALANGHPRRPRLAFRPLFTHPAADMMSAARQRERIATGRIRPAHH